ncbi:MAG: istA [bacterium]|nr:MAG: istA [bacterium]
MRLMGIEAIYQKPNTSKKHPEHEIFPYLLRDLTIDRVNQVWCADITYIPMAKGFLYLVAIMDWASRRVLAWRLSNTMEADFCVEALEDALSRFGCPEIFNTDQGSQFTGYDFTGVLKREGIKISMDGKGRFMDNIFIERRSLKYEEVFIKAYASVAEARAGIGAYLAFYNDERPHQSFDYQTPRQVFECGHVDDRPRGRPAALPPCLRPRPETWGNARLRPHAHRPHSSNQKCICMIGRRCYSSSRRHPSCGWTPR